MPKGQGQVKNSTSTQTSEPWSGQAPYLRNLYQGAQDLSLQEHYPGQSIASQAPETLESYGLQNQRARAGSPLQGVGQGQLQSTLQGDYLTGGPGFNSAFDAAQRRITPAVQGAFEGVGRFGGGLQQTEETQALGDAFAGLYGSERNRQMAALNQVPSMAASDQDLAYQDISALGQVGGQREGYQQALLGDQMNRWNFAQQAPYDRLGVQSGVIQSGFPGGNSAMTQYGKPGLLDVFGADMRAGLKSPGGDLGNIWSRLGSYDSGI